MMTISRRFALLAPVAALFAACSQPRKTVEQSATPASAAVDDPFASSPWRQITPAQWRERLSPEAFAVLREEATERPRTSPLNAEKRKGTFHCAGCDLPLFRSDQKYESGTGWPSFTNHIEGAMRTKLDTSLFMVRTEYHCAQCLGHQGHVFDDGPPPTGQRWCNNGVALTFKPEAT
jgi:peptide-methionine (R)-S-oxide reductase